MTIHTMPRDDIRPHTEATTCECGPVVNHYGGNMHVVHNSFDGREALEQAQEILGLDEEEE